MATEDADDMACFFEDGDAETFSSGSWGGGPRGLGHGADGSSGSAGQAHGGRQSTDDVDDVTCSPCGGELETAAPRVHRCPGQPTRAEIEAHRDS